MIQIIVNKFLFSACPTVLELEPTLVNIPMVETIEVKWNNSRQEQAALQRNDSRTFSLYVPDVQAAERTASTLEQPLTLDSALVEEARLALKNKKLYNWREFSRTKGSTVTRNIVLKIAADDIRKGVKPKLAYVAKDVFLDGVNPQNADTLLRLRILRGF